MMQRAFRILLYLSVVFFIWYLYNSGLLEFTIDSPDPAGIITSLLLLFAGFIGVCISWYVALRLAGHEVPLTQAVISQGVYIFSKYIPGKLWVIVGRASWFSNSGKKLKQLSVVSLQEQLVFLFWGIALSLPATMVFTGRWWTAVLIALSLALLGFLLFSGWLHDHSSWLFGKLFKKEFDFNPMKLDFFFRVSLPVILFWLLWASGFWLLAGAMLDSAPLHFALIFPAAMTYGFVVIFMPAGLGVREGIVATFLMAGGVASGDAITLSVVSRIWFITGEVFLFMLALVLRLTCGKDAGYPEYPST